jgi:hypothetical protein
MASSSQGGIETHVARYSQFNIATAAQLEDFIDAGRPASPSMAEKLLGERHKCSRDRTILICLIKDMYDLDVVSNLLETDSSSFFAAYSRGDWDPTSIPPMPPELSQVLGNVETSNGLLVTMEKRVTPPALEKSVEDAYRTYLSDAKAQTTPVSPQSYAHLTSVSDDSTPSSSDITLESALPSLPDESVDAELEAAPSHGTLPDQVSMGISDGSNNSRSTLSVLACSTPPSLAFPLAAASRFAAVGLYRVKCLPAHRLATVDRLHFR